MARHARPDAHLPEGRFPRRPPLRACLHGERPAGARRRPRRDARHRVVLPARADGHRRHAESRRRRDRSRGQRRRLAVGQFHPHVHPSRVQSRPAEPHGVGRRLPAHRRPADADEPPLCAARRRRRRLRTRQRGRRVVDSIRGQDARTHGRRPARPLHRDENMPENHRSLRLVRVLGPAHVAGSDRHRRQRDLPLPDNVRRYYYPGTTHGGGRGGFRSRSDAEQRMRVARQPQSRSGSDARADPCARRMGDEGHAAARQPIPAPGERRSGAGDARRGRLPDIPGLPFSDRVLNPSSVTTSVPASRPSICRAGCPPFRRVCSAWCRPTCRG